VVTANRIIAAAAESAGLVIGGLDQTGLSQKAGAVVSHLHLAASRAGLGSPIVGAASAGLYLSGDILQAAAPRHLDKIRPGQTIAVVDAGLTPTAAMLQGGLAAPELASLRQAIVARAGAGRVTFVDAKRIAERVFSDHLLANVILLGAAFQLGGLPVSLDDIDSAMRRPDKAAAANRAAFEWGRWSAHDPAAVEAILAGSRQSPPRGILDPSPRALAAAAGLVADRAVPPDLSGLVTRRAAQVIDYQHANRARRYLDLVARVAAVDDAEHQWALTRAVAESWHKLLTYKDEYEVARLHLAADYGPHSVTYHLHPPVLRAMKRLRGTPFDVFGADRDRRTERALIAEYERLVDQTAAAGLPYDTLVLIAESAMSIKGYGPVKEKAVAAWRTLVKQALA
jgi:indolepyruvate ferredoxin oxidoreductase